MDMRLLANLQLPLITSLVRQTQVSAARNARRIALFWGIVPAQQALTRSSR